jgi:hypothetical protein
MVVFAFPESTFLFLGFALAAFPRECGAARLAQHMRCDRTAASSDQIFGDADVRVGDVKPILFNVVQALAGIHSRRRLPVPAQVQ